MRSRVATVAKSRCVFEDRMLERDGGDGRLYYAKQAGTDVFPTAAILYSNAGHCESLKRIACSPKKNTVALAHTMGKKKKQLSQAEIWDDSALLQSWDEALEEYKAWFSSSLNGTNC